MKSAVKFISDFEQTVVEIAIDKEFDVVCCGHIHQPEIKEMSHDGKKPSRSMKFGRLGGKVLTALRIQHKRRMEAFTITQLQKLGAVTGR